MRIQGANSGTGLCSVRVCCELSLEKRKSCPVLAAGDSLCSARVWIKLWDKQRIRKVRGPGKVGRGLGGVSAHLDVHVL
jgi:hypothetical protein